MEIVGTRIQQDLTGSVLCSRGGLDAGTRLSPVFFAASISFLAPSPSLVFAARRYVNESRAASRDGTIPNRALIQINRKFAQHLTAASEEVMRQEGNENKTQK